MEYINLSCPKSCTFTTLGQIDWNKTWDKLFNDDNDYRVWHIFQKFRIRNKQPMSIESGSPKILSQTQGL